MDEASDIYGHKHIYDFVKVRQRGHEKTEIAAFVARTAYLHLTQVISQLWLRT